MRTERSPADGSPPAADDTPTFERPADDTYRRLAASVIARAFRDMTDPACPPAYRETARDFLAGSRLLVHWCQLATLDPRRVIARATMLRDLPSSLPPPDEAPRAVRPAGRRDPPIVFP